MKRLHAALFLLSMLLVSCAPAAPTAAPRLLSVYVSSAASPRLSELYQCAPPSAVIKLAGPDAAELTLRLGEPVPLLNAAYQVGSEDLLIVTHPQAGVGPLTLKDVQELFSGLVTNWKDV